MLANYEKILRSARIFKSIFTDLLTELLLYIPSPSIFYLILRSIAKISRRLKIIWSPKRLGRKPISDEIRNLVIDLKKANPTWGGQKISDELKKVGLQVSKKTVLKIFREEKFNFPPPNGGLTWKNLLAAHKFKVSRDFTCVMTLMGDQLFSFAILNLDTREIIHINSSYNPTLRWVELQFKNALYDFDIYPTLCICDRDSVFAPHFSDIMRETFQIKVHRTPYKRPWYNGKIERLNQSIKREAFENVIPISLSQTQRICSQYKAYYNEYRCHQSLGGKTPTDLTIIGDRI